MENRIAEFKLLRDCALPADSQKIALPVTPPMQTQQTATVRVRRSPKTKRGSKGTQRKEWRLPTANSAAWRRMQGVAAALDFFNPTGAPLVTLRKADIDTDARAVSMAMLALSRHLADAKDMVTPAAIREFIAKLQVGDKFAERVQSLMPAITSVIVLLLQSRSPDFERLADATRLLGVGTLLIEILLQQQGLSAEEVRSALSRKLFLPPEAMQGFPLTDVRLIRAACVSDLYVVRSEWRGYAKGEIAALKNIMAGESLKQVNRDTRENERTQVTETQQSTQEEASTETRTTSELSREVSSLLSASLQAKVDGEVTGAFPGGTYRLGASAEGNIGISVAERTASRTAQEAVTKAVSRVDTSVRAQRTTRDLVRLENEVDYELANTGATNRRGVYRWLDRVERFMVFKFPDRLQMEFQLPNPAEFYKYRIANAAKLAATGGPPDWKVTLDIPVAGDGLRGISTQSDADFLATLYRAPDMPAMPKESISITDTVALEAKNVPADDAANKVISPVAAGALEIVIPDGYEAIEVKFFMSGSPVRAQWVREASNNDANHEGWDTTNPHVFHSIVLESFIGGESEYMSDYLAENQGLGDLFTTQGRGPWSTPSFGNAFARSTQTQSVKFVDPNFNPPYDNPVRVKLKLGFRSVGAAQMEVGVQVMCRRTAERFASWRQQVFDILYAAWARWDRDFRGAQNTATLFGTSTSPEKSSSKNREMIQEELKRQVISWLLEEVPFLGRPAMNPAQPSNQNPWREFDVGKLMGDAPTIQFFEQALDWPNMGWIFYPYYWAGKSDWLGLAGAQASDPEYERFMRSGSVRVLVPVRSSFEDAMQYWLTYRKPFLGRGLPLLNDPMFVSVASEIRRLTEAPEDGEPVGRAWDSKTATTYLWLEDNTAVPSNENIVLGLTADTEPLRPIKIE